MSDGADIPARLLTHVSSRLLKKPLLVTERKLDAILHAATPTDPTPLGARLGLSLEPRAELPAPPRVAASYRVSERVAVIPIMGSIVKRTVGLDAMSGLVSVEEVQATFRAAMKDSGVEAVLFQIDSDGGEVHGIFDLADVIFQARGQGKPIWAVADEAAYSAAYLLASAADHIVLPRTAGVGSVGVIAVHLDVSEANKAMGLNYTVIKAGEKKDDFSPLAPLSDPARDRLQAEVDRLYGMFVGAVARNRGLRAERVQGTEAGTFQGPEALGIKFADEVGTFEDALLELQTAPRESRAVGGRTMSTERTPAETPPERKDNVVSIDEAHRMRDAAAAKAKAEAKAEEQARTAGIDEQLKFATIGVKDPSLLTTLRAVADKCRAEGKTRDDAMSLMMAAKVAAEDATAISGVQGDGSAANSADRLTSADIKGFFDGRKAAIAEAKAARPQPMRVA